MVTGGEATEHTGKYAHCGSGPLQGRNLAEEAYAPQNQHARWVYVNF